MAHETSLKLYCTTFSIDQAALRTVYAKSWWYSTCKVMQGLIYIINSGVVSRVQYRGLASGSGRPQIQKQSHPQPVCIV